MLTTTDELEAHYGTPHERALRKEIDHVNADYRRFIELSPFVVLATGGPDGLDCSPRGDAPGFVRVLDERTLALPDRPGNNRVDSLRNVVAAPQVGLLFMVPGVGEMLRVNGRARVSVEAGLLDHFAVDGKPPRSVLLIDIESAYFHCAKAIARSHLWDASRHVERSQLPSAGDMLRRVNDEQYGESFDVERYEADLAERMKKTLY
ncbi:pyridoxamine 5'-phosphate oxidase family protein [Paraburkholderia tropica]|uniref:pyridoxamine 5'-phosphate oxidase family protein n=1 Tax=Paraburkholderia tropica TaxID=92647 RepID=UPI000F54BC83|nr:MULTISPECIES: pyridoxamine 5'-phosphate oxidase family protein [Paraburkholderia]QNB13896.1 pyridoxamine 5'-phosphate oxidase family protein [Paraburkholderia tropica]RQM50128.1 pyridoxamine 5'-phosphate oxidase family protein [Paraburkholderia bannensis]